MDNPKCTVIFSRRLLLIQSYKQLAYTIIILLTINIVLDVTLPTSTALVSLVPLRRWISIPNLRNP
jgi:hypothetical protein